jgi:hypothetical protein
MLDVNYIRSQIYYDPKTGNVWWLESRQGRDMTKPVGCWAGGGSSPHLTIRLDYKRHYLHRVIWLYMTGNWPDMEIDHIDGNPENNKWANLRLATASQNQANKKGRGKLKGVTYYRSIKRWVARIGHQKTIKNIGTFDCPAAAHFAYQVTSSKLYGQYARIA